MPGASGATNPQYTVKMHTCADPQREVDTQRDADPQREACPQRE